MLEVVSQRLVDAELLDDLVLEARQTLSQHPIPSRLGIPVRSSALRLLSAAFATLHHLGKSEGDCLSRLEVSGPEAIDQLLEHRRFRKGRFFDYGNDAGVHGTGGGSGSGDGGSGGGHHGASAATAERREPEKQHEEEAVQAATQPEPEEEKEL